MPALVIVMINDTTTVISDPAHIFLVGKLNRWILSSCFTASLYKFLNYVRKRGPSHSHINIQTSAGITNVSRGQLPNIILGQFQTFDKVQGLYQCINSPAAHWAWLGPTPGLTTGERLPFLTKPTVIRLMPCHFRLQQVGSFMDVNSEVNDLLQ